MRKWIFALLAMFLLAFPAFAEGETPISTPADLAAIANNPSGSYMLMNDIDMTGQDWSCPDFSGTLNGNGHAILNLKINRLGSTADKVVDGNVVEYQSTFAGLFRSITNADIHDLKLINLCVKVETDEPCFIGSVAGRSSCSKITNCQIISTLELRAHKDIFGVGGVFGYGSGMVRESSIQTTMICTDTDAATKDEQFLGGIYAIGFGGALDSTIDLDAYISDHGYVHSGGVAGMIMEYLLGDGAEFAYVDHNTISGRITFFEDNANRRAYCDPIFGEINDRTWRYGVQENQTDGFIRDERTEFDRDLRPDMCENPQYTESVNAATCDTYGCTEYTCKTCGYIYRDNYVVGAHKVNEWQTVVPATADATGLSRGTCSICGTSTERVDEKLTAPVVTETTPAPAVPETTQAAAPTVPETTAAVVPETAAPTQAPAPTKEVSTVPSQSPAPVQEVSAAPTQAPNAIANELTNLILSTPVTTLFLLLAVLILLVTLILLFAVIIRAIRRR